MKERFTIGNGLDVRICEHYKLSTKTAKKDRKIEL